MHVFGVSLGLFSFFVAYHHGVRTVAVLLLLVICLLATPPATWYQYPCSVLQLRWCSFRTYGCKFCSGDRNFRKKKKFMNLTPNL